MSLGRALLVLGRVSNLPTIWSNCLCGWLIGAGYMGIEPIDWRMVAWVGFGATALYLGGMYLNDACDVAFDREHRKERPIPSGAISESAVWKIGIGLLAVGMGALSIQGGATALLALGLRAKMRSYCSSVETMRAAPPIDSGSGGSSGWRARVTLASAAMGTMRW